MSVDPKTYFEYLVRLADTNFVLGHRLSEWLGKAPTIEEELALTNIGLDLIGQARAIYRHALSVAADERDEDQLVFLRDAHEYRNLLLVENENGDFGITIARQLAYSVFACLHWQALAGSKDADIAGIAAKAAKESVYHMKHAGEWLVRLGDGSSESHRRCQVGLDRIWMYTGEMFEMDGVADTVFEAGLGVDARSLKDEWQTRMDGWIHKATLKRPGDTWMASGGNTGRHTEHLGPMLAEMQFLQRAYPGQKW
jgi:ring-1,2-phenylacetyl-CoA epoxidase subunit PaaC